MYPILKSGDIIGYKEISSFDNVIYGEIYLVSFMIDGEVRESFGKRRVSQAREL